MATDLKNTVQSINSSDPQTKTIIADRFSAFGTSVFSRMSQLAQEYNAINLSQGFPDTDGPELIKEHILRAMKEGHNQYARSMGHPELVSALSQDMKTRFDLEYDAMSEVIVFSGATEGLFSSIMGLINPGDEVILFEPFYDSYPACVSAAGGLARYVPLRFPKYELSEELLRKEITSKTRLILLNTPHNPTGKVFTRSELETIQRIACEFNLIVITDEVYEHLTYDDAIHIPIATLPGMRDRNLRISSFGKTFSYTGFKIGFAYGPKSLVAAAQAAHQFVTFASSTPMQVAYARTLAELPKNYYQELKSSYQRKREILSNTLHELGYEFESPQGAYFILASFKKISKLNDLEFAEHLTRDCGVAAIPPSSFYKEHKEEANHLVRFSFSKKEETLQKASQRLQKK